MNYFINSNNNNSKERLKASLSLKTRCSTPWIYPLVLVLCSRINNTLHNNIPPTSKTTFLKEPKNLYSNHRISIVKTLELNNILRTLEAFRIQLEVIHLIVNPKWWTKWKILTFRIIILSMFPIILLSNNLNNSKWIINKKPLKTLFRKSLASISPQRTNNSSKIAMGLNNSRRTSLRLTRILIKWANNFIDFIS